MDTQSHRSLSERSAILRGNQRFTLEVQRRCSVQRPVRIAQRFAGEQDDIGLSIADDCIGLQRLGDEAYRRSKLMRLLLHSISERNLIARPGGYLDVWGISA